MNDTVANFPFYCFQTSEPKILKIFEELVDVHHACDCVQLDVKIVWQRFIKICSEF